MQLDKVLVITYYSYIELCPGEEKLMTTELIEAISSVISGLSPAHVGGKPIRFDSNDASEVIRGEMISILRERLLALQECL